MASWLLSDDEETQQADTAETDLDEVDYLVLLVEARVAELAWS